MKPPPILQVEGLGKEFHGFRAVDGVNLAVAAGSVHALIGPNGAGKTTLFNLMTRFLDPTEGTIRFKGEDVTRSRPAALARAGMVRSFQISSVFPALSCIRNVQLALQRKWGWANRWWLARADERRLNERARELLSAVGLGSFGDLEPRQLSYGRRRALEIATTLALEPELMLLDEPTAGMGVEDIDLIVELIRGVAKSRSVLLVEHNLGVVSSLCDRVTVVQRGRVLCEGSYAEVAADERVKEAYLGGAA